MLSAMDNDGSITISISNMFNGKEKNDEAGILFFSTPLASRIRIRCGEVAVVCLNDTRTALISSVMSSGGSTCRREDVVDDLCVFGCFECTDGDSTHKARFSDLVALLVLCCSCVGVNDIDAERVAVQKYEATCNVDR